MSFYPSEWFAADQSVELNKRMARLEREREALIEALEVILVAEFGKDYPKYAANCTGTYWSKTIALLARMKENK